MNSGISDTVSQRTRSEEIINSPARIIRSGVSEIGPPSVCSREVKISLTEYIDKSDIHECIKSPSLFYCESMLAFILFRIFEIYWLMSDIEVSTENNWFMFL